MTDKLVQWIRDLTIRRKLLSGIAIVLALNAYLALYAINRLSVVGAAANSPVANQIVSDTRGAILVLVLITIGIGVAVALLLGRLIADPFTALGLLAERVAKGDLTVDIRSASPGLTWREMMCSTRSCHEVAPPAVTSRPSASAKHRLGSGRKWIFG